MNSFFSSLWPGLIAWMSFYVSDYTLTLICARLYRGGANQRIVIEGSFEITPYFQRDIDSLKVISPRFLVALIISSCYLSGVWWLAVESQTPLYEFVLGMMISTELAVHHRHLRNLFLFRALLKTDAVQGRIQYPRPLMLRMSALENLAFSAFFAVLFAFTWSWFLLGGVMGCFVTGLKHLRLARQHIASTTTPSVDAVVGKKAAAGSTLS